MLFVHGEIWLDGAQYWCPLDSAPKNRFGLSVIFSFNLVQLKGIYQNFAISRAFNIAPRPLKILKDFLKDLGKKKVNA